MAKDSRPETKFAKRFPGGTPLHGSGEMYRWEKVGQEMVGEFVGIKPYKNGHIANVKTEDGVVAFSAPTILAGILQGVRQGSRIAIVFSGEKKPTKRGQSPTKQFEVYALDDEEDDKQEDEDQDED